jgi:tetratricopeptide (TPR) repeat protein
MRAAARKAIALDPLLAEAHAALGLMHARDGQWREAEDGFRRAIDLDRNRSRTFVDFAVWMLFVVGRNEEALEQLQRAEAVDPLSTEVHSAMAWVLMAFSRFDEAAGHCAKMTDADSFKQQCLGRARLGQGRIDEAVQILSSDPTVATNPQSRGFLGHAYARAGRRDEAERMAAEARFANEQALIYAGLGDTGRAFEAAERMASAGPQRLGRYLQYPELAVLRADSRLPALREKAGLPRGAEERRN